MGSNPISSGAEVERAGEINYVSEIKNRTLGLVESSPPED